MSDKAAVEGTDPAWIKRVAEARGLGLAHALFPEIVAAAVARARTALGSLPADFSPTTEPAVMFDPAGSVGAHSTEMSSAGTSAEGTSLGDTSLGEPT